ncbi:MAG: SpoIIE family protein phosphatase [Flavobacteriales bacterium]
MSLITTLGASSDEKSLLELLEEYEKALASEKRFHATLDNMMEGFQMISHEWRYLYVNDTVVKQSKYSREELIGFTMMEKYPGIEHTLMFDRLKKCMYERLPEKFENEFTFPDGSQGWFELSIQPVHEGLFILSMDITKRKKAEKDLRLLNEELESLVHVRTQQLSAKNKDIMASITYAERIQSAFLSDTSALLKLLPDSFLINKPKDIISGDFVWYREEGNKILLAVVDCTGHGVPGALMSVICAQKLNEVMRWGVDLSEALQQLNRKIKEAMKQGENSRAWDGMDIALCRIDRDNNIVKYAGANRPIWIMHAGESALKEIKPTNKSIGGLTHDQQYFETHYIQMHPGDVFYLCTDGYADQFGGEKGKKLTTKKFKQLLLEVSHKSMKEQSKYLLDFSRQWMGDNEQVDDMLVLGIRL